MKKVRENFAFKAVSKDVFIKRTDALFLKTWHRQYKYNRYQDNGKAEVLRGFYP